jgi:hypothetical protein
MAAPRLNVDPNLQVCPDFGADEFAVFRNALAVGLNVTAERAVEDLAASWTIQNAAQKVAWTLQLEADDAIERVRIQEADVAAAAIQAQADREADDALRDLEKKRPRMHTFNPLKSIGADILPHPSPYALERVKKFEYVELWYFSPEGCRDALSQRTSTEDSFGITKSDADFMLLKPVASVRASRKAVPDEDISWDQMEIGATLLLRHMRLHRWPEVATDALSLFWYKLQNHEMRSRPNGQKVLMEYQARVRREWHAALDRKDEGFNIGLIDSDLLAKIGREVIEAEFCLTLQTVRPVPPPLPPLSSADVAILSPPFSAFSFPLPAPLLLPHAPPAPYPALHPSLHRTLHRTRTTPCTTPAPHPAPHHAPRCTRVFPHPADARLAS